MHRPVALALSILRAPASLMGMELGMSSANLARALEILHEPRTAADFWRLYEPDDAGLSQGELSKSGHPPLRSLVQRGLVRRNLNGSAASDTFVAVDAPAGATAPAPGAPPAPPPELHVEGGSVVEVQRRPLGRLATVPEQPQDGELHVDADGNVVRVTREVLGRAQLPQQPPPQAVAPAPPQQQPTQPNEGFALSLLLFEVAFLCPDRVLRARKLSEACALILRTPQAPPWMREKFNELWLKEMQAPAAAPATPQPAPQQQPAMHPSLMGGPPVQPPPGVMWVHGYGFVSEQALANAMGGDAGPAPPEPPPYRGPYRSGAVGAPPAYTPPVRQKTVQEQFREATSVIRLATELADQFGPEEPEPSAPAARVDRDSPIRVIDAGPAKLVIDEDGASRIWETVLLNAGPALRWWGDRQAAMERARREQEASRRQLPQFIEVVPPQGFAPAPAERQQVAQEVAPQPEAPVAGPPPHANGAPSRRRMWDLPVVVH